MFNTWMGDPAKVILLEALVDAIKEENLLENATVTGQKMVNGITKLQVCRNKMGMVAHVHRRW